MARYLFTMWSAPGHIFPNLAVANVLRARGHDVAFYTGTRATSVLASLGVTHFPMRHVSDDELYEMLFPTDDRAARMATLGDLQRMRTTLRRWLVDTTPGQLRDLEPLLDEWRPDVIVCDPTMWAPFLVLHEARRIPVAIFSWTIACMLSGRDIPPWGRGLPLPTTWGRRLRVDLERLLTRAVTREFRAAANALRQQYGLAPLKGTIIDFAGTMPLYMVAGVPEYDYNRHDLPPHVSYVGHCVYSRPSGALPSWVEELPADRPLVYVTEGTVTASQPRLLQAAARGLAGLPLDVLLKDAQIVDPDRDPASVGLGALAPNIRRETYTPGGGGDVLQRSTLVITNGGAGSVMAALTAGVPLIVVPTAWDKPENAQRVVEAGAGLRLPAKGLTPERLRQAVLRVLGDPAFRANAQRIAEAVRRYDGPRGAADLLEKMCVGDELAAPQTLGVY